MVWVIVPGNCCVYINHRIQSFVRGKLNCIYSRAEGGCLTKRGLFGIQESKEPRTADLGRVNDELCLFVG